ncbi:acyltransferase family protein [Erythrobacter crassostreae]|uniref:Acyltransferase family protein n=1 Tax=Erythrobacter crassostreae TaxID=2828328 RepID=A0A9X1JP87_9SPHN|nr:acyltransferase family protein [Erythrobacter crassostrea]MBV7259177.1 acyltransferase family protein [Erythrobacter crassostrea]
MQNSTQVPLARKHYHDIDGARSVLMFLSVALHAGTVYAPARPWITGNTARADFFDWLIFGFHLFVTPTFFFVGGFFAVLLLTRRAAGDFISNRLLRTAVPLVAIALTFNMIEHYLRWVDSGGAGTFLSWIGSPAFIEIWANGTWQLHLWFLVSLLPMFLLAVVIHSILPKESRLRSLAVEFSDRLAGRISGSAAFAVALLIFALVNTANYSAAALVPGSYDLIFPGFQSWYKLVSEFPFFVIGVMAALSPRLLSSLFEWRWWMPYAAAAALFFQPYPNAEQSFEIGISMLFLNQLAIWTIVLFILQFFHRFFSEGGARTRWLADCALSMYLFHHCFVYIYGQMLTGVDWHIAIEFTVLTVAAAGTVIAIHEGLVRRFAIVRLLFNGKTDIEAVKKQPGLFAAFTKGGSRKKAATQSGAVGSGGSLSPR